MLGLNKRAILVALVAIVAAVLGGCTGERIYFPDDAGYARVTAALKLSAEDAQSRVLKDPALETRRKKDGRGWLLLRAGEAPVIGDWYAFLRSSKAWLGFEGYYVHGVSGEVEYRASLKELTGAATFQRHRAHPSDWTSIEKISIPD